MADEIKIAVDILTPHPRNNEFFDDTGGENWQEFLRSVKTSDVIAPIVITQDNVIVSGHQRVRACKELGIKKIKYTVKYYNNEDEILKDLIETNLRQRGIGNLNPVKFGRCIKELERIYGIQQGRRTDIVKEFDNVSTPHTETELAERMGLTRQSIQNYKKLAELIPEVEDFLDTGMISATTALAVTKQLCKEDQKKLIADLDTETKYTKSEIDKKIKEFKEKQDKSLQEEKAKLEKLKKEKETLQVLIKGVTDERNKLSVEVDDLRRSQQPGYSEMVDNNVIYDFCTKGNNFISQIYDLMYSNAFRKMSPEQLSLSSLAETCNKVIEATSDLIKQIKTADIIDIID